MEEIVTLKEYDHVCIIFGHKEPNIEEFEVILIFVLIQCKKFTKYLGHV